MRWHSRKTGDGSFCLYHLPGHSEQSTEWRALSSNWQTVVSWEPNLAEAWFRSTYKIQNTSSKTTFALLTVIGIAWTQIIQSGSEEEYPLSFLLAGTTKEKRTVITYYYPFNLAIHRWNFVFPFAISKNRDNVSIQNVLNFASGLPNIKCLLLGQRESPELKTLSLDAVNPISTPEVTSSDSWAQSQAAVWPN